MKTYALEEGLELVGILAPDLLNFDFLLDVELAALFEEVLEGDGGDAFVEGEVGDEGVDGELLGHGKLVGIKLEGKYNASLREFIGGEVVETAALAARQVLVVDGAGVAGVERLALRQPQLQQFRVVVQREHLHLVAPRSDHRVLGVGAELAGVEEGVAALRGGRGTLFFSSQT